VKFIKLSRVHLLIFSRHYRFFCDAQWKSLKNLLKKLIAILVLSLLKSILSTLQPPAPLKSCLLQILHEKCENFQNFCMEKIRGGGFLVFFLKNPSKMKTFFHWEGDLSPNPPWLRAWIQVTFLLEISI